MCGDENERHDEAHDHAHRLARCGVTQIGVATTGNSVLNENSASEASIFRAVFVFYSYYFSGVRTHGFEFLQIQPNQHEANGVAERKSVSVDVTHRAPSVGRIHFYDTVGTRIERIFAFVP